MTGALDGLLVLDLASGQAGAMAAMLLADQGARVVKVEPPGGDPERARSGWRVWNRGKESLVLDLESTEGADRLRRLAARADVLIESFEPGTTGRLGLADDDLRPTNPRLVYCSITGYPDLAAHAGRPATDALVAARTGLQWEKRGWPGGSVEHANRVEPVCADLEVDPGVMEGPPRPGPLYSAVPWPSLSAFHLASIGIGAALHARERTGRGQLVRTSLFQGALVNGTFTWQLAEHPERPGYLMWVTDPRVPHGFFQTADGRWVHNWTPQPGFVLGVSSGDHLALPGRTAAAAPVAGRVGMEPENLLVLLEAYPAMADAFARFTAAEWEEIAAAAGVSVQTIRSPEEALCTRWFLEDGCVTEVDDPDEGPIRHVGLTVHLHASPGSVTTGAPRAGEHTARVVEELLGEEGAGRGAAGAPSTGAGAGAGAPDLSRGPLSGVVVLDVGLAVAGPFGTQMLADLGADVIKVNRAVDRGWTDTYMGMSCNRGKRSITIDLKSPTGVEVFHELVKRADVVHTNMRLDAVEALGIDYERLKAFNPQLIYCHTRGFERSPRILLVGHDQSGSALAGVAWEEGGLDDGGKPLWPNISLGDTGNGMLSATAVLHALYHRDRTGEGQFVDTSIVYVHLLNASAAWLGADGHGPERPRLDAMQLGTGALRALYETAAGWLCIDVETDGGWAALCRALGTPELGADPRFASAGERAANDRALRAALEPAFRVRTAPEWSELLDRAGVPAEVSSETFALELFDDPELYKRGLVVRHEHPLVGHLDMTGTLVDFSDTPATVGRPPIVPGQHSREILAEAGYGQAECDRLIAAGAVGEMEP